MKIHSHFTSINATDLCWQITKRSGRYFHLRHIINFISHKIFADDAVTTSFRRFAVVVIFSGFLHGCKAIQQEDTGANINVDMYFSKLAKEHVAQVVSSKLRADGMLELYLEGEPYTDKSGQRKTTKIFALYKFPEHPLTTPSGKTPGMVLVHGGGGTAFKNWVDKWNDAGFAAISVAVEGQTDIPADDLEEAKINDTLRWQKHLGSGPSRQGIYADSDRPLQDQWMFHAVSAVIRAKHFLTAQADIDKQHIGLTGISWGGVITSTVMGFDGSFDFSIPIYGCGFLDGMQNQYQQALMGNSAYQNTWEPGHRISNYRQPSLWLTWRDDKHFALDAQASTYQQLSGDYSVSIKPGIRHGHKLGWDQPESYLFARQIVRQGTVWAKSLSVKQLNSGKAQAEFSINLDNKDYQVAKATIHYTADQGHTGKASWTQADTNLVTPSSIPGQYIATFDALPLDVRHWFVNLQVLVTDENHKENQTYTVSSELFSN
ncbi:MULTISPECIES: alpha/beta hydrolase family protein [Aliiglaciecola]|uniref:alpha/beta hydrolase family protein n=1 Tax=Aliiglaciecola TaxID=1406885 RepID=UPI001C081262|nr:MULTISPECIES: hypothetical protein [Aliiglaciecola]MBU2877947.1 hypothetical protein [Aliiglaciecola lipolytica]MDO6709312.1 hypothetical protein [Aliiglaciecola sp. 2_MG-2023]MDO6750460.1 hypothetical protein [Aliiglaciecola sp. 1_MG-2023]